VAEDDKDIESDDDAKSPSGDDAKSPSGDEKKPAPEGGGREGMILKGIIAAALLGGLGYIGYLYHRTPAGEPCNQSWHCKSPVGYGSAQCRKVVGRGNICVLGCTQGDTKSCPDGFTCDQLVWDEGGVQTAWFCLPTQTVP
jgi:hypothetical protein